MNGFEWYGEEVMRRIQQAGEQALKTSGLHLKGESQQEAPLDTGDLRANATISDIIETPQGSKIQVGYSLPYALRQHEHTEYRHPRGGKAKYLEDPYKQNKTFYGRLIKEKINEALR